MAAAVGDAEPPVALTSAVSAACVAKMVNGIVPAPATAPLNVGLGNVLFESDCVAASVTIVSLAAGKCRVKLLAPALSLVNVVAPVDDPSSSRSELACVCAAVHVFACPSASEATTAPVVGLIVSVPSLLDADDTAAAPEHEPHPGAACDPLRKH